MTPIPIHLPPLARYQRDAIFTPARMSVIEATTKAGKTEGCLLWQLANAAECPQRGSEHWWVAPVFPQTEIAYRRQKRRMLAMDPGKTTWESHDSKLTITLKNDNVMRFKSADNPDSLYGEDVYSAVLDEASRCKEESWHAVRSTLTATRGKCRIIGNVNGRKNWAYLLARRVEAGVLEGWKYAKITAADAVAAGIIMAEEVEAARRELPEHVFRELYLAEPSEDGANPFGLSHIAAITGPLSTGAPVAFGVDLAKSVDWTVVTGIDEAGVPCVFERWQHEPWERTQSRVRDIVGDVPALVDSTGVGDPVVESMAAMTPTIEGFKFTSTSKQQLMEGLAVAVQRRETGVLAGVMRSEMDSFEYEMTRTGVRYSAPEGFHDDCVCSLALAVERKRTARRLMFAWADGDNGKKKGDDAPLDYAKFREDPEFGFSN